MTRTEIGVGAGVVVLFAAELARKGLHARNRRNLRIYDALSMHGGLSIQARSTLLYHSQRARNH
jgi:hypothetical protein